MTTSALAQAPVTVPAEGGDVSILADRMDQVGSLLIGIGNVEITKGSSRLTADRVEINRETGEAVAQGKVIFYDGQDRLLGDRIDYNLKTGTGVVY
ncbi:MAG: LptA/OstA family protein, partial [candidate division NC10 bacterium]